MFYVYLRLREQGQFSRTADRLFVGEAGLNFVKVGKVTDITSGGDRRLRSQQTYGCTFDISSRDVFCNNNLKVIEIVVKTWK